MKNLGIRIIVSFGAILIILFLILLLIIFINNSVDNKTVSTAKEYLTEKYKEEMVLDSFFKDIIDLNCNLTFYKKENPDFKFTVYMSKSKILSNYEVWKDDYFETLICYGLKEKYTPIINNIWGNDACVTITSYGTIIREFSYLDEYSTIKDIKDNGLNKIFTIFIDLSYFFDQEDKEKEAEKILKFINIIKEDEYLPEKIAIERLKHKNEFSKKTIADVEICHIDGVEDIITIDQVYDYIDKEWFREVP